MHYIKTLFLCLGIICTTYSQNLASPWVLRDIFPSDQEYQEMAIQSMAEDLNWYPRSVRNWLKEHPQKAYFIDQCFRSKATNYWFNYSEYKKQVNYLFEKSHNDFCHQCFIAENNKNCEESIPKSDTNSWIVLEFDCKNPQDSSYGKVLAELLIWKLKEMGKTNIIDRVIQKRALDEYQLQSSGLTEKDTLVLNESAFKIPNGKIVGYCSSVKGKKQLQVDLISDSSTQYFRVDLNNDQMEDALNRIANQIMGNTNTQYDQHLLRKHIVRKSLQLGIGIDQYLIDEFWTQEKQIFSQINLVKSTKKTHLSPSFHLIQRGVRSDHEFRGLIPISPDAKAALEYMRTHYLHWNWGYQLGLSLGGINLLNNHRNSSMWNTKISVGNKIRHTNWSLAYDFELNWLKLHEFNEYFSTQALLFNWGQNFTYEYDWENWTLGFHWTLPFEKKLSINEYSPFHQNLHYNYYETHFGIHFSHRLDWK